MGLTSRVVVSASTKRASASHKDDGVVVLISLDLLRNVDGHVKSIGLCRVVRVEKDKIGTVTKTRLPRSLIVVTVDSVVSSNVVRMLEVGPGLVCNVRIDIHDLDDMVLEVLSGAKVCPETIGVAKGLQRRVAPLSHAPPVRVASRETSHKLHCTYRSRINLDACQYQMIRQTYGSRRV